MSGQQSVAGRSVSVLIGVLLFFVALRFFLVYALPFLIDLSPDHLGGLWPRRHWLVAHIAGAGLALLIGPLQLWSGLRRRSMSIHRWTGRLYLAGVLIGGAAALYLASHTPRGALFGVSLGTQGVVWLVTTGVAYVMIRRHDIQRHKEWMIRSYLVTFAFVTFRGLQEFANLRDVGQTAFVILLWLAWVLPLLVAEYVVRRRY